MKKASATFVDGQPAHAAELAAIGDVLTTTPRDGAKVKAAREALRAAAGSDEAIHDAVATAAFFAFMTRVVDTSGHTNPMMEVAKHGLPGRVKLMFVAAAGVALVAIVAAAFLARRP